MHKVRNQIKKAAFTLVAMLTFGPVLVFGQVQTERPKLLDIQQSYQRGEIDVDRAVLEQFRMMYEPTNLKDGQKLIEKCATPAHMFLHRHRNELSEQTRSKVEEYRKSRIKSSAMLAEESYISPSGKFEVIYYTSGGDSVSLEDNDNNGTPDYVERVAEAADSSYRHMVNTLGYPDPIYGNTNPYPVYIESMGGIYGFADYGFERNLAADTFIAINNNFDGFPDNTHPAGITVGAIYVTMAHEFKHAIQYIQNNWSGESDLWLEMDATLMEEVVYDNVNDYYNYIYNFSSDLFSSPSTSLIPGSYEDITWALFFEEYIGPDFWVEVWERIEAQPSIQFLEAVDDELSSRGYDFDEEVVRSYMWHFVSGSRSGNDGYGFEEKEFYPEANTEASFFSVPNEEVLIRNIKPMASRFLEVSPSENDYGPIEVAVDFDSSQVGLGFLIYLKSGETVELLATGRDKQQVFLPSTSYWEDIERLGVVVSNFSTDVDTKSLLLQFGKSGRLVDLRDPEYADLPESVSAFQNYPNPFNPITNISFELSKTSKITLEVYDIMGRKIQTLANETLKLRSRPYVYEFNAKGLSSGVYIYRLRIDNEVYTKKMTLVK
ncbi:T9SS type A sorting domain-containing protein [Gracilimonas halophila]|uniref:T9SS type A sorting domain-containing protein n=1 Tax=Gracilimonas halophila TaxID=1834464 RepID=A0ABW5JF45_9BACT